MKSGPFAGYFSGGGDAMAIPREQVQERLFQLISNLGITFGLIFSGVAGSALSPFNVEDFDAGSNNRTLANVYNLLANHAVRAVPDGTDNDVDACDAYDDVKRVKNNRRGLKNQPTDRRKRRHEATVFQRRRTQGRR